jgi:uncharacterized MAPEG superfamily protein
MGVHPTFRTPILELMPNVINKIKQNSSDWLEREAHYYILCRVCYTVYYRGVGVSAKRSNYYILCRVCYTVYYRGVGVKLKKSSQKK